MRVYRLHGAFNTRFVSELSPQRVGSSQASADEAAVLPIRRQ